MVDAIHQSLDNLHHKSVMNWMILCGRWPERTVFIFHLNNNPVRFQAGSNWTVTQQLWRGPTSEVTNGGKDGDDWINNREFTERRVFVTAKTEPHHNTGPFLWLWMTTTQAVSEGLKANSNGSTDVLLVITLTLTTPDSLSATPLFLHVGENCKLQSGARLSTVLE